MNRILYLAWDKVPGSGGARVADRNCRWLRAWCGEGGFRTFNPGWRAFYPWPRHWKRALLRVFTAGCRRRAFDRVISGFSPDLIFLDSAAIALPPGLEKRIPVVVFCHNVEVDYARAAGESDWEIAQVAEVERRAVCGARLVIAQTNRDSSRLANAYGRAADYILPITLEEASVGFVPSVDATARGSMLFVGSDFFGNTDGLFWFVEKCLPELNRRLVVVGRGMERYRGRFAELERRGLLEFRGGVDNLSEVYRDASCVVLPLISGGGMKTKTIEALMYGKRIYGTDEAFVGCEGIDAVATRCRTAVDFIRELRRPVPPARARDYFHEHFADASQRQRFLSWLEGKLR